MVLDMTVFAAPADILPISATQVRHTQTLMSLSHTLKILLLTADATSPERDRLLQEQSAKSAKDSQEAMDLVNQILHKMEQRQDQPSQAEQSEPRPV